MSPSSIASFLVLFGAVTAGLISFGHSNVVIGVVAIVAAVLLFARK